MLFSEALATATVDLTQAEDDAPEQQSSISEERAQMLEQASDAARTQRDISLHNLAQREGVLTCPISLELFVDPVVTMCCGKTFSSEALRRKLLRSSLCPFCLHHECRFIRTVTWKHWWSSIAQSVRSLDYRSSHHQEPMKR
ncbi:hypothetical protein PHYSODRAFT_338597 [Phytophthora sojae]|uniref:U-box domain-containing protein n=1 Tax=Phytophthora sojae (strain P6497) TaxID=1094619 RepID=G5A2J0_PHYSP|nr:hypothetical protein PHYSODRAFT_338597 [Phytophthora sojae]EGZ09880.1 hypothetical protein PHYSODRAFT_338597 [Phytophthora sojae]|eukprot:XP_009534741.1 hypothetical protein PHYSODRAFT_338597 [Phytophthora sojae]